MVVLYHLTSEGVRSPESEIFRQSWGGHVSLCTLLRGLLFAVSRASTPRPDEVPKTGFFCKITVVERRFLTGNHHFDIAGASNCLENTLEYATNLTTSVESYNWLNYFLESLTACFKHVTDHTINAPRRVLMSTTLRADICDRRYVSPYPLFNGMQGSRVL